MRRVSDQCTIHRIHNRIAFSQPRPSSDLTPQAILLNARSRDRDGDRQQLSFLVLLCNGGSSPSSSQGARLIPSSEEELIALGADHQAAVLHLDETVREAGGVCGSRPGWQQQQQRSSSHAAAPDRNHQEMSDVAPGRSCSDRCLLLQARAPRRSVGPTPFRWSWDDSNRGNSSSTHHVKSGGDHHGTGIIMAA